LWQDTTRIQDCGRLKMKMQIGDLVRIKSTTELKNRCEQVCFVEDLLGYKYRSHEEKVSLYGIDGNYVGDWFEDEFDVLGRKISVEELDKLIEEKTSVLAFGLVKDFKRVRGILIEEEKRNEH